MTEKFEIYKCELCGNLIQVLQSGAGHLICCGEEMKLESVQYKEDELGEKHTPFFTKENDKKFINVTHHPMQEEHYIQFIEIFSPEKDELHLKFFNPQEHPKLETTHFPQLSEPLEYCNIHNLWGNKSNG